MSVTQQQVDEMRTRARQVSQNAEYAEGQYYYAEKKQARALHAEADQMQKEVV